MRRTIVIGGSPCSGKSTLSEHLAEHLNCQVIKVDDYMGKHIKESDEVKQPMMYKWKTQPWYELFSRPVDVQLKEEIQFYIEEWEFLKRDIHNDMKDDLVIIEGCALMPSLAAELLNEADILYMVPTESFQKEKYAQRTWAYDILEGAEDPQDAFCKWMERDIAFAKHVKSEAEEKGYSVIVTDGVKSVEQVAQEVLTHLAI